MYVCNSFRVSFCVWSVLESISILSRWHTIVPALVTEKNMLFVHCSATFLRSIDISLGLFVDSAFFSIHLFVYPCTNMMVLITIAFQYVLIKDKSVLPICLLFFNSVRTIFYLFLHKSFRISLLNSTHVYTHIHVYTHTHTNNLVYH